MPVACVNKCLNLSQRYSMNHLLELEPTAMKSSLVKMDPDKLESIVENYDELARALRGTEFERFLY